MPQKDYGRAIAKAGLEIGAIKLRPHDPFTWAQGDRMPIYNDNRMFLFDPEYRELINKGILQLANNIGFTVVAGTSTAGIPHGAVLADRLKAPFVYIRDKPKDHGLRNQIEGIDADKGLEGTVLVVEDLISTGGSSAAAVQAVRDAGGQCYHCISIFNYGFDKAVEMFKGDRPFDKEGTKRLIPHCQVSSLLTYDVLMEVAKETGRFTPQELSLLEEWRTDPFGWGPKHGFPKVEKK